jgi:hypothetical protein
MSFAGNFNLGDTAYGTFVTKNTSGSPVNATSLPTFRVYGSGAVLSAVNGTAAFKDTGTITGATNATPIVITCASHGLSTGTRVTVVNVGGNTAANGTFDVTVVNANSFSLDSSVGNAPYTSGGTWNTAGLYKFSFTASGGNGFAAGSNYAILLNYTVSATAMAQQQYFGVV